MQCMEGFVTGIHVPLSPGYLSLIHIRHLYSEEEFLFGPMQSELDIYSQSSP